MQQELEPKTKFFFWFVLGLLSTYSFVMAKAWLLAELQESKAEIQRLKERMYLGAPTIHKDLSLITLIPNWSGPESAVTLEEFFDCIEGSSHIGQWQDADKVEIVILKLAGPDKVFFFIFLSDFSHCNFNKFHCL